MSSNKSPNQSDISFWTAEFTDPSTEITYRRRNAGFNVRQTRFGLGLWGVLLILFIYIYTDTYMQ